MRFLESLGDTKLMNKCVKIAKAKEESVAHSIYRLTHPSPPCLTCGEAVTKIKSSTRNGYYLYCSTACAQRDPKVREKFRKSMVEKHGVPYSGMSPKIRKKMQGTQIYNFGSLKAARAHIREKSETTCLERYGVKYPSQDREILERLMKSGYQIRTSVIGGKEFHLRGYEPAAIQWLYSKGIKAKNILTTAAEGVPTIWYNLEGKRRAYHPDFLVKNKKKDWILVEVKSSYTSGISGDLLKWKELQTKAKASTDEGYTFRLLLVIKVKEPQMFVTISDVHLKTRKAVIKEVRDQISQGATHLIHSNLLP